MTSPCTFENGKCVHCSSISKFDGIGNECEGWNEPTIAPRERELMAEVEVANIEIARLRRRWGEDYALLDEVCRKATKLETELAHSQADVKEKDAALKLALEAIQLCRFDSFNMKFSDLEIIREAITAIDELIK